MPLNKQECIDRWQAMFGEQIAFGFEISVEDIPLIERCLETRDSGPLDREVERRVREGGVF